LIYFYLLGIEKKMKKSDAAERLDTAVELTCDAVGGLVQFLGFKSVSGRVWGLLYLSDKPLDAAVIAKRLKISTGACSMAINDLLRMELIEKSLPKIGRSASYQPVTDLWRACRGVMRERETKQLSKAIATLKRALLLLEEAAADDNQAKALAYRIKEFAVFLTLLRIALNLFLDSGKLDLGLITSKLGEGRYVGRLDTDPIVKDYWEK